MEWLLAAGCGFPGGGGDGGGKGDPNAPGQTRHKALGILGALGALMAQAAQGPYLSRHQGGVEGAGTKFRLVIAVGDLG